MKIDIQTRGFDLTTALEQFVRQRLDRALAKRYPDIRMLQVRLKDINGPRGGDDKCCRIYIGLPQLKDLVIEHTESDMYTSITRAVSRANAALNRRLARQRARTQRRRWSENPAGEALAEAV